MNWLINTLADIFGLHTTDEVLAIRPAFDSDATKVQTAGEKDLLNAAAVDAKIAQLAAESFGLKNRGNRKVNAAAKWQKRNRA